MALYVNNDILKSRKSKPQDCYPISIQQQRQGKVALIWRWSEVKSVCCGLNVQVASIERMRVASIHMLLLHKHNIVVVQ